MKNPSIKFLKGDLLKAFDKGKFDCIAHQCNTLLASEHCGGIAKIIFGKYANVALANNLRIKNGEYNTELLGNISYGYVVIDNCIGTVFNLYSQHKPGSPSNGIDSLECRLSYLKESLYRIRDVIRKEGLKTLGIPLIASGLAKHISFQDMPDLEYFKKFILPTINDVFGLDDNIQITVMHL
jgi:O-acetyl-ADP-ribose deacetylase (regulator of RNase III)